MTHMNQPVSINTKIRYFKNKSDLYFSSGEIMFEVSRLEFPQVI